MLNVNILNELIKGITEQIPLVQSYYTTSPYECWNVEEVKYGSVSFVITRVNTRESTTTYDATIYYADRLLEDNANRDSVHSDAATVIQTIVGALNTADDMLTVSYPVAITLFEQSFEDRLAGGYAQMSVSTKGMGECFDDEFEIPAIVGTSAYWTKDEIMELFPLRTQLATVAYTGAFDDLKGVPDLVTKEQYDDLVEGVTDATGTLARELEQKVSTAYFDEWADNVEKELGSRPTQQNFDTLRQDLTDQIETINSTLGQKVNSPYFENWKEHVDAQLDNSVTKTQFDNLTEAVIQSTSSLAGELENKVDVAYFDNWADDIEADLNSRPTGQSFNNLVEKVNSNTEKIENGVSRTEYEQLYTALYESTDSLAQGLDSKLGLAEFNNYANNIDNQLDNKADKQTVNNLIEQVETTTARIDYELAGKLSTAYFENWVAENEQNHATQEQITALNHKIDTNTQNLVNELNTKVNDSEYVAFRDTTNAVLKDKVGRQEFDNLTEAVIKSTSSLASALDNKLDDAYFEEWSNGIEAEVDNRVTRQAFDNFALNIYDKEQIDTMLSQYELLIARYLETDEFKDILLDTVTPIVEEYLETALDYYTKEQIDDILANISLENYYTKEEVDTKIANVEVDLSGYYTKTEVDNIVGDINTILDNVLYEI